MPEHSPRALIIAGVRFIEGERFRLDRNPAAGPAPASNPTPPGIYELYGIDRRRPGEVALVPSPRPDRISLRCLVRDRAALEADGYRFRKLGTRAKKALPFPKEDGI